MLTSIPPTLYRDVANYIKTTKNGSDKDAKSTTDLIISEERRLLSSLITRLLQLRVNKILLSLNSGSNGPTLTPEEKYIIEPLIISSKRTSKLEKAIGDGRTSFLETIIEKSTLKYSTIRFLKDSPSMVGTDLLKYGPFIKEDVAILPMENIRLLAKQDVVQELDIGL